VIPLAQQGSTNVPRYFFHIRDDQDFLDNDGTVLPGPAAARAQAATKAGAMLRDKGETFWSGTEWQMIVTDEAGQVVCELRFSARCPD
jgi:hypothetical protein